MGLDIGTLMSQAQEALRQMEERKAAIADKLSAITVTGTAGCVEITLSGDRQVRRVSIDPAGCESDKRELLEDLVFTALSDALRKVDRAVEDAMAGMSEGIEIGGFDLGSLKSFLGQ